MKNTQYYRNEIIGTISNNPNLTLIKQSVVEDSNSKYPTTILNSNRWIYVKAESYTDFHELFTSLPTEISESIWSEPLLDNLLLIGIRKQDRSYKKTIPEELYQTLQDNIEDLIYFYQLTNLEDKISCLVKNAVNITQKASGTVEISIHKSVLPDVNGFNNRSTYDIRSLIFPPNMSPHKIVSVTDEFITITVVISSKKSVSYEESRSVFLQDSLRKIQFECPNCHSKNKLCFTDIGLIFFYCTDCSQSFSIDSNSNSIKFDFREQFDCSNSLQQIKSNMGNRLYTVPEEYLQASLSDVTQLYPSENMMKLPDDTTHKRVIFLEANETTVTKHIITDGIYLQKPYTYTKQREDINKYQLEYCHSCQKSFKPKSNQTIFHQSQFPIKFDESLYVVLWTDIVYCKECITQLTENIERYIDNNVNKSDIISKII